MAVMTPVAFAEKYFSLDTYIFTPEPYATPNYPLAQGSQQLRVEKYRLSESPWAQSFWTEISKRLPLLVDVRVHPIDGNRQDVRLTIGEAEFHFKEPFSGKGTPEEAQIAIQLVYRYHKTTMPPEHFVKLAGFVGLDCNGFVGSYIQRVVRGQTWQIRLSDKAKPGGSRTYINTLFNALIKPGSELGSEVTDIQDLKNEDTYVLALCDKDDGTIKDPHAPGTWGHVMITEPNSMGLTAAPLLTAPARAAGVAVRVVQASGPVGTGVLHHDYYTLHSPSRKSRGMVFTLSGKNEMPVRVARLKLPK